MTYDRFEQLPVWQAAIRCSSRVRAVSPYGQRFDEKIPRRDVGGGFGNAADDQTASLRMDS